MPLELPISRVHVTVAVSLFLVSLAINRRAIKFLRIVLRATETVIRQRAAVPAISVAGRTSRNHGLFDTYYTELSHDAVRG